MKTNARTLTLAALLALLGGAHAGAAGGASRACTPDTAPKITVNGKSHEIYDTSYGEDIVLQCSAKNATQLEMREGSHNILLITEINTTTIQFFIKKPEEGIYGYVCVDDDIGCEDSVVVIVETEMSVQSSSVHYKQLRGVDTYFVPLGEDYEVYCSGHDSADIYMESLDKRLQTDVVSMTVIKYATLANRVESVTYKCSIKLLGRSREISVVVDYYPECHNFSCVAYDGLLQCLWNYSSDSITTYKLFYTNYQGYEDTIICSEASGKVNSACKVVMDMEYTIWSGLDISFLLMSCNILFCNNQTFIMNPAGIKKLEPVYDFVVLNTSTHGVLLEWKDSGFSDLAYKVEYRQIALDDDWRQTDFSIRCSDDDGDDDAECQYDVALPYPDAEYEVRVSARYKEATDDRVWSDPASLRVTTARVEECACSAAPDAPAEPTTTVSAETALCQLCKLREDMIKESLALKYEIKSSFKTKRVDIQRIRELLPGSTEMRKILDQYV